MVTQINISQCHTGPIFCLSTSYETQVAMNEIRHFYVSSFQFLTFMMVLFLVECTR